VKLFLKITQWYIPAFLKKRELKKLFKLTAETFECDVPSILRLTFEESLSAYAQFTRDVVERNIGSADTLQKIQDRLFQGAYEIGETYRRRFRITGMNDALEISKVLYRIIGIDLESTAPGMITIRSCFFSKYYSSSTCRVISYIDAGMLAGLSDGGTLSFSRRITEGFDCCQALFMPKEYDK
jgi:hypothetical protein